MDSPPLFTASGLGKRFGHHAILRDVTFEVGEGEFLLLLGGNGAGKSTLLNCLSSLMRPSAGELRFRGAPYAACGTALRAAVGVISHESRFYGDLTARENLRVFGTLYSVAALKDRIEAALREFNLEHVPDVPVRAFSSGMVKRLALARLTLYGPRALLLDEPYAGLDQDSVALLDGFLERFKGGAGTTVLVTHQFTAGLALCDRLLILHQGRLVYNRAEAGLTPQRCAALLQEHGAHPQQADHA